MDDKLYLRRGTSQDGAFSLVVTPEQAGWTYSGLKVLTLPPGGAHTWATGEDEILVLPLSGSATVTCGSTTFELTALSNLIAAALTYARVVAD